MNSVAYNLGKISVIETVGGYQAGRQNVQPPDGRKMTTQKCTQSA